MSTMKSDKEETEFGSITCPSANQWQRYALGTIEDEQSDEMDSHLNDCDSCNILLSRIETQEFEALTSDPLALPATSVRPSEESQIVASVVHAAKAGRLQWDQLHSQSSGSSNAGSNELFPVERNTPVTSIGPYRLLRPLAAGGMGRVYLAEHIKLQRQFALKLVPQSVTAPGASERFEREIRAIGKLSHPAIVQATDAGADSGYLYLAMEYIDGWDLSQVLRSSRALSTSEICEIGKRLALALSNAHHQGMVHRDIKPSNVMLDKVGNVKLLDFGLVLLDRWDSPLGELTTVGQFLGTLDYMAPEQAEKSAAVDHRSDIYSLGATLFKLLAKELPLPMLPHQSPLEKLRVLRDHAPVGLSTLRTDLPDELCRLIDGMLLTDPNQRPSSAAVIAEKLDVFTKDVNLQTLADDMIASSFEVGDRINPVVGLPLPSTMQLASASGGRNRWWRRGIWLAAATLPFAMFYGIHLVLEDSNGNLVIESELDDIDLKIVRTDGAAVKDLQINQGNQFTKLKSGNYEIQVPADTATVSPQSITLSKGDTIIARIQKIPVAGNQTSDPQIPPDERHRKLIELIPDDKRNAVIKGQRIGTYLERIQGELEFNTWKENVAIVREAVPDSSVLEAFINEQYLTKNNSWRRDPIGALGLISTQFADQLISEEIRKCSVNDFLHKIDEFIMGVSESTRNSLLDYKLTLDIVEARILATHNQNRLLDFNSKSSDFAERVVTDNNLTELMQLAPSLTIELLTHVKYKMFQARIAERQSHVLETVYTFEASQAEKFAHQKKWNNFFQLCNRIVQRKQIGGFEKSTDEVSRLLTIYIQQWLEGEASVQQNIEWDFGHRALSSAWIIPSPRTQKTTKVVPASIAFLCLLDWITPKSMLDEKLRELLEKLRGEQHANHSEKSNSEMAYKPWNELAWANNGKVGDLPTLIYKANSVSVPISETETKTLMQKYAVRDLEQRLYGQPFSPIDSNQFIRKTFAVRRAVNAEEWEEASKHISAELLVSLKNDQELKTSFLSTIRHVLSPSSYPFCSWQGTWDELIVEYRPGNSGSESLLSECSIATFKWEDFSWKLGKLEFDIGAQKESSALSGDDTWKNLVPPEFRNRVYNGRTLQAIVHTISNEQDIQVWLESVFEFGRALTPSSERTKFLADAIRSRGKLELDQLFSLVPVLPGECLAAPIAQRMDKISTDQFNKKLNENLLPILMRGPREFQSYKDLWNLTDKKFAEFFAQGSAPDIGLTRYTAIPENQKSYTANDAKSAMKNMVESFPLTSVYLLPMQKRVWGLPTSEVPSEVYAKNLDTYTAISTAACNARNWDIYFEMLLNVKIRLVSEYRDDFWRKIAPQHFELLNRFHQADLDPHAMPWVSVNPSLLGYSDWRIQGIVDEVTMGGHTFRGTVSGSSLRYFTIPYYDAFLSCCELMPSDCLDRESLRLWNERILERFKSDQSNVASSLQRSQDLSQFYAPHQWDVHSFMWKKDGVQDAVLYRLSSQYQAVPEIVPNSIGIILELASKRIDSLLNGNRQTSLQTWEKFEQDILLKRPDQLLEDASQLWSRELTGGPLAVKSNELAFGKLVEFFKTKERRTVVSGLTHLETFRIKQQAGNALIDAELKLEDGSWKILSVYINEDGSSDNWVSLFEDLGETE